MLKRLLISCCLSIGHLSAQEAMSTKEKKEEILTVNETLKEEFSETHHTFKIHDEEIHYKAVAGNLILKNEQRHPKASVFYIAYFKEVEGDNSSRPLIFCFNGGPGSSSVWLHMGFFGPRRVVLSQEGESIPPYQVVNNEYSILDLADLVFIDPVSTGYSRAAPGEDAKQFHGVDEDIESISEFIRQFITTYERWDSPKLLAGASYGTTRAAGLAGHLHDEQNIFLNGIILISSILNFQTINDYDKGNDLPYPLYLPTYFTTAWYHKKLGEHLQKDFDKALEEVLQFANTDYTVALMQGDRISDEKYTEIVERLSAYTGLSTDYIKRANLRINPYRFTKELLRSDDLTVGRFDARITGVALDSSCDFPSYDPSLDSIIGAFTATFNQYVRKDLKVKIDREYKILADINTTWNYTKSSNKFLNMSGALHDVMSKNNSLKIFVSNGYYDLATPFYATDYTFNHLRLIPSLRKNVSMYYYPAGHLMYTDRESMMKMKEDLRNWMKTLKD